MFTDHIQQNPQQQVLEILKAPSRQRKRRIPDKQSILKRRLNEVIMGNRPVLKLFSKTLQTDFWFINEGLVDLNEEVFPGQVITMEMLAEMMSDEQNLSELVQNILNNTRQ